MMDLEQRIKYLENRIHALEEENIETTNVLYEILNTLDSFKLDKKYLDEKWGVDYNEI